MAETPETYLPIKYGQATCTCGAIYIVKTYGCGCVVRSLHFETPHKPWCKNKPPDPQVTKRCSNPNPVIYYHPPV